MSQNTFDKLHSAKRLKFDIDGRELSQKTMELILMRKFSLQFCSQFDLILMSGIPSTSAMMKLNKFTHIKFIIIVFVVVQYI